MKEKDKYSPLHLIINSILLELKPGESAALMWPDQSSPEKKIVLSIRDLKKSYDMTLIGNLKTIEGPKMFYHVKILAKNFGREMIITENASRESKRSPPKPMEIEEKKEKHSKKEEKKEESHSPNDLKIVAFLQGIGISIIDNDPKEVLYFSIYKCEIELEQKIAKEDTATNKNYLLSLDIGHIQFDNMLEKSYPVIFGPQRLFVKEGKKKVDEEECEPFIQFKISFTESRDADVVFTRYDSIQLQISEMTAFVDQEILMNLLKIGTSIGGYLQRNNNGAKKVENPFKKEEILPLEAVCPSFDARLPQNGQVSEIGGKKIFLEFLHLAAVKVRLTLRLEKTAVEPNGPHAILDALYSIIATLSNISDAPIYFKELIMKNMFSSPQNLVSRLSKNYIRQAILQFYKLLGAIDLIGNPIGLVDKLGSGVFEFFNEPRKGIMKGPKEFAKGLGKGFKSLVTHVIAGGLDSVSRVTGSLYSLVKNIGGEKVNEDRFKRPDNAIAGALHGIKGGAMEVVGGIAGIFSKPFKGAREEGAKGFIKGIGKGLLGAITSPVTAILKVGTSLTQGIEGTVTRIGKGGVAQQGRMRFPRYISPSNRLSTYDESLSEGRLILITLDNNKFASESVLLFDLLPQKKTTTGGPFVIITEKRLLLIKDVKNIAISVLHANVKYAKLYDEKEERFILEILEHNGKKVCFETTKYPIMSKCLSYFPQAPIAKPQPVSK